MVSINRSIVTTCVVICLSSCAMAFFWGSEPTKTAPTPWPVAYYQQRYIQAAPSPYQPQQQIQEDLRSQVQIPAIPIQVPLQAQLSPAANIHNVQLVPCLCPVSQDFEYETKIPETFKSQTNNAGN